MVELEDGERYVELMSITDGDGDIDFSSMEESNFLGVKFMTEQQIQNEIILAINQRGHRLWRANAGKVQTKDNRIIKLLPKGFPDTFGYRKSDGKFIAIEVKQKVEDYELNKRNSKHLRNAKHFIWRSKKCERSNRNCGRRINHA